MITTLYQSLSLKKKTGYYKPIFYLLHITIPEAASLLQQWEQQIKERSN
jgi:hypothetical protein